MHSLMLCKCTSVRIMLFVFFHEHASASLYALFVRILYVCACVFTCMHLSLYLWISVYVWVFLWVHVYVWMSVLRFHEYLRIVGKSVAFLWKTRSNKFQISEKTYRFWDIASILLAGNNHSPYQLELVLMAVESRFGITFTTALLLWKVFLGSPPGSFLLLWDVISWDPGFLLSADVF